MNTAIAGSRVAARLQAGAPREQPQREPVPHPRDEIGRRCRRRSRRPPAASPGLGVGARRDGAAGGGPAARAAARPRHRCRPPAARSASRMPGCAASSAPRRCSPATAAPVPIASTCRTTAEPVAAHGAMPARCAISAMPATAHTLPGQVLAEARDGPDARGASTRRSSLAPPGEHRAPRDDRGSRTWPTTTSALSRSHPGSTSTRAAASQLLPVAHQAARGEDDDREARPPTAAARSHGLLRTQGLAIPPLAQSRPRGPARAARATTRRPAWPAPGARDPAADRGSRRSAPRPTAA